MNASRMRRLGTKNIGLIFQYIQHRALYGNRNTCLSFQSVNRAEMSDRNNLSCGMCMMFT